MRKAKKRKITKDKIKRTIIQYLKTTDTHPTAEEIFNEIKKSLGKIDKQIFLKQLNNLEKEKKILCILSLNNEKHYDIKAYHHYHFICEKCGMVRDIIIERGAIQMIIDHAQRLVNSYAKITKINLSFQGICHECRKNN